jgi:hypothetical protein
MKLSIEVRRDGELLGWYVTDRESAGTHFRDIHGNNYAYGATVTPLSAEPVLHIVVPDDLEDAIRMDYNFIADDPVRRASEIADFASHEQDRHLPPAEAIQSDDGSEVRYVREVYTDQDILGVLAHARRSLATRLEGADTGYDRVINHLIKATNYLEQASSAAR